MGWFVNVNVRPLYSRGIPPYQYSLHRWLVGPHNQGGRFVEDKYLTPAMNRTTIRRKSSPWPNYCNYYVCQLPGMSVKTSYYILIVNVSYLCVSWRHKQKRSTAALILNCGNKWRWVILPVDVKDIFSVTYWYLCAGKETWR